MRKTGVLLLPEEQRRAVGMPKYEVNYSERDTLPELIERKAEELDITVEELIKRFICTGMQDYESEDTPSVPGEDLNDFLVKNGVLKDE